MTFGTAISTCFSKYFTFAGRAARSEFWWFFLFYLLGAIAFSLLDALLLGPDPTTGQDREILSGIWGLALYIPLLAAAWRRLQDTGRPGWYALIPMLISLVTLIGLFTGIFAFAQLQNSGVDPDSLRGPATFLGFSGIAAMGIAQLVVSLLMLYWLTRPSDIGPNAYGPAPYTGMVGV